MFYWTKGIVENFILILKKLLENNNNNSKSNSEDEKEKIIESITFAIYNLSQESSKIILQQSFQYFKFKKFYFFLLNLFLIYS